MLNEFCPVCNNELISNYDSWHLTCKNCNYEKANLTPTINLKISHQYVDEGAREVGLKELRIENFSKIYQYILLKKKSGLKLLDIGCAHGWFLDIAKNDFEILGIEPDETIFKMTTKRGLPVRLGYFPQALDVNEKFDIIIFNDVIEHIPDVNNILDICYQRLNKGGMLVLNLPSTNGVFYRLSKILCFFGINSFFERLWQKNMPSPHLHYFNSKNLVSILKNKNFVNDHVMTLSSLQRKGLYKRISYTGNHNFIVSSMIFLIIYILSPLLMILPKDIICVVSYKEF